MFRSLFEKLKLNDKKKQNLPQIISMLSRVNKSAKGIPFTIFSRSQFLFDFDTYTKFFENLKMKLPKMKLDNFIFFFPQCV